MIPIGSRVKNRGKLGTDPLIGTVIDTIDTNQYSNSESFPALGAIYPDWKNKPTYHVKLDFPIRQCSKKMFENYYQKPGQVYEEIVPMCSELAIPEDELIVLYI